MGVKAPYLSRAEGSRPVDAGRRGDLGTGIMAAAGERGTTYQALVDRHGVPPFERLAGSVELRGSGPELVVVVSVDKMVVSPLGAKLQLGNRIALQVRRPKVGRSAGDTWLREAFELLCARLSPAWGSVGHAREYWAKVMSDQPLVEAVGRDFGRFLPGLFWLNFCGRRYCDLIGDDRLRSAPAERVATVDDGVLIVIGGDPAAWDTPEYVVREQRVRTHLGTECSALPSRKEHRHERGPLDPAGSTRLVHASKRRDEVRQVEGQARL